MRNNTVQPGRPQMTKYGACALKCWIPKATKELSEYVILVACPLQQPYACASMLRFYVHCMSFIELGRSEEHVRCQAVACAVCGGQSGTGTYMGADKSLARPGRKQATATEDFEFHISYL